MRVVLGNRHAIQSQDNGSTFVPLAKGKRATVVDFPEGTSIAEAIKIVTDPQGVWTAHAVGPDDVHVTEDGKSVTRKPVHPKAVPAWVASDSPGLAAVLAEEFGCPVRDLEDPYEGRFPAALLPTMTALFLGLMLMRCTPWLKTNAGNDFQAAQMGGSASATAVAKWVALTANATAASATDTTLTAEITTAGGGLVRKAGTYAHTTGAASYTITTVFTANGSDSLPVTIAKRGIFDASSAGNMVFETVFGSTATLSASGDALTVTDTIST